MPVSSPLPYGDGSFIGYLLLASLRAYFIILLNYNRVAAGQFNEKPDFRLKKKILGEGRD